MPLILFTLFLILLDIFNLPGYVPFFRTLDFHSLSALITGLITFSAMVFIDNQNKKRWEKSYFQKFKNEQILELIKLLNKFCQNYQRRDEYNIQQLVSNYEMFFDKDLRKEEINLLKDLETEFNSQQDEASSKNEQEKIIRKLKTIKEKLSKIIVN